MRLIDKDVLEDAVQGAINIMQEYEISIIAANVSLGLIRAAPTVDAIPVEWLREKMNLADDAGDLDSVDLISWLIQTWQKEQEAR